MTTLWFVARRTVRTRARACLGVAVLLAVLGGLSLASFAGARRTSSAYTRFRNAGQALDVQVNAGSYETDHPETAGQMPNVTHTASYSSFLAGPVLPDGRPDPEVNLETVGSVDGLYFTQDGFAVTTGRLPDPARPDEVAINEHLARALRVDVGHRYDIGVFDPAQEEAVYTDSPPPPVDRLGVTIVGVGLFPDEVVQDDTDRQERMLFTPAFTERERGYVSYTWTGVSLRGGAADVAGFKRDYTAALPGDAPVSFREKALVSHRTQQAVRPLAVALAVFGAMAALATMLLVGQAVVRLLRADRDDLVVLRAIGAGPGLTSAVSLPGPAVSIVAGAAGAVVIALLLSPLTPIGPLRRVEVDPGVSFDATVLLLGAVGFAVALGLVAVITALRQAPHRRQALEARVGAPHRSALVGAVSAAGFPAPAVAGIRLALEPGGGRTAVPVRAALAGAVVAVVAVVAALVFGSSLRSLVDEPRLYGWDWDVTVVDEAGYGDMDIAKAHDVFDHDDAVAAWSGVFFQSIELDHHLVPAIGMEPGAPVVPPILSGRPPLAADDLVLGSKTLEALGKKVGDTVAAASPEGDQRLRIVGTAVFPTVGPVLGSYTSLGEGALLAHDRIPGWDEISPGFKALFVRMSCGADRAAAVKRMQQQLPGISHLAGSAAVLPVQRPAEIVNYSSMGATPAILGGVLVLAAVGSLGLTLASGVARRRRELSILKSLGFTPRQVSATVLWQASIIVAIGLVIGIPLGIVLGRWLWTLFARGLAVLAAPTAPVLALGALAAGLLLMGVLVSVAPARRASRIPVATILRSE